jgi:drug/metabolite transporter (DMT)-like permease
MSIDLVGAEGLMSLYPVVVKKTTTSLLTQTMVRLVTSMVACYPFITSTTSIGQLSAHIVSWLYVFHIFASYIGFTHLNVGTSLTIFYLYPLVNVLLFSVLRHSFDPSVIPAFVMSIIGVFLITRNGDMSNGDHPKVGQSTAIGVIAMMFSVLSESLLYVFHKTDVNSNPFEMLFKMCFSGSIGLSAFWLIQKWFNRNTSPEPLPDTTSTQLPNGIIWLVLVNLVLGVGGYLLRFRGLSMLSPEMFSILSFSGVLFGYAYGWLFFKERLQWSQLIGTLMIIYSVIKIRLLGYG